MNTNTTNIGSGPVMDGFKPFPPQQQQSTGPQFQQAAIQQKPEYNSNKEFSPNNNVPVPNSVNTNNPRVQRHRGKFWDYELHFFFSIPLVENISL